MMGPSSNTIWWDLGRILQALSLMFFVSIPVGLVWGEPYVLLTFGFPGLLALGLGTGMVRRYRTDRDPGKLHAMIVAAAGWFIVATIGSLPFFLTAWLGPWLPPVLAPPDPTTTLAAFENPINALFESMSGFTGTGLTMTLHEDVLPASLQWWRSLTEWIGGVGVIVLTTAILARPGSGSMTLYESEARSEKIHPSVVSTVRTIWWIFILFTVLAIGLLWAAGMPLWHAINHAMTGLATGGFSVTDQSIASYHSATIDMALVPVMVAGSIAFPVHYQLLTGDLRAFGRDIQTKWVIGYFLVGSLVVSGLLLVPGQGSGLLESLRFGLFQFVSAASCTGFQTAPSLGQTWPVAAQLVLAVGMVIGGAAGSTVGGIKVIRAVTLTKVVSSRLGDIFLPRDAVSHVSIGDRTLSESAAVREFTEASIISLLWLVFLVGGALLLVLVLPMGPDGYTLENVIFEVASAQGNVGLSTGITGPGMPLPAKVMFLLNMWIGRLEIIPVIVLLRAIFVGLNGASRTRTTQR